MQTQQTNRPNGSGRTVSPPATTTKDRPRRMTLGSVVTEPTDPPVRVLIYGVEGVGKTSTAAGAPAPIVIPAEEGSEQLTVARFPLVQSLEDVYDAVAELTENEHSYKTVVLDTVDAIEPLVWEYVCREGSKKSIEAFGFGKGYVAALDEWRKLWAALERLRSQRGMNVVLIGHVVIKPFQNPEGDNYDRYNLRVNEKAAGFLKGAVDAVLFANYETLTHSSDGGKAKGISTGARLLYTQRTAAYDAKNRYDLPPQLPLSWEAFDAARKAHRPADPARMIEDIQAMLDGQADELRQRVESAVEKAAGNAAQLARIKDRLAGTIASAAA